MLPYIVNRFGTQLLPVLFLASILVFMSVRLIPGDPAAAAVGENATPEAYFAYREQLGLNDPWYEQYFNWIGGVVVGDFGISTKGAEASEIIWSAFPATIELTLFSLIIGFGWGTVLGLLAAVNRGGFWDYFAAAWTGWNIGVPSFIAGLFYLLIFAVQLDLLPAAGRVPFFENPLQSLQHLLLPSLALGGIVAAGHLALRAPVGARHNDRGLHPHGPCQGPARPRRAPAPRAQAQPDPRRHLRGPADGHDSGGDAGH